MAIRWKTDPRECPHTLDFVCPTCDFDRYYAHNYVDCPWGESEGDD